MEMFIFTLGFIVVFFGLPYVMFLNGKEHGIISQKEIIQEKEDIINYKTKYLELLRNYISLSIYLKNSGNCLQELEYIEGFMKLTNIDVSESLFRESLATINKYLLDLNGYFKEETYRKELLYNIKYIDIYYK